MRKKAKLLVEQLDRKLEPFLDTKMISMPERGWINTIRTSLNMTMAQLGSKLNITRQGVKRIEDSEARGSITIRSLKEVANAMELKLVYALIPKEETIHDLVDSKAIQLAKKIVSRTNQNMKLEGQGIGDDKIDETVRKLAGEIKREMRRSLWD